MSGKATTYRDNITGQGYTAEEYVLRLLKDRNHLQAEVEFHHFILDKISVSNDRRGNCFAIRGKYYTEAELREEFKGLKG